MPFEHRGVWCSPEDFEMNRDSVCRFLDTLANAGINHAFIHVKNGKGEVFWPCEFKPELIEETIGDFDLPKVMQVEAKLRGIKLHAWFINFFEGPQGEAFKQHPEWAMRNAEGGTTDTEDLRGGKYYATWMCPAQRNGYATQWLIPLMAEFAKRYEWQSIHHDYIRYPGDLAPDRYCFCDDCLDQIPRYAGYFSEMHPTEPFHHENYDRPYVEAHWESPHTVLPADWKTLPRAFKSKLLLEGSFFPGGRADLDYFFYKFRAEAIERFAKETAEAVRAANPNIEISAAVFKNPIHCSRFNAQDWRRFHRDIEYCIPMDYREHYPGGMEMHLDLLEESIKQQQVWAKDYKYYWCGISPNSLYKEEHAAEIPHTEFKVEKLIQTLNRIESTGTDGVVMFNAKCLERFGFWDDLKNYFDQ